VAQESSLIEIAMLFSISCLLSLDGDADVKGDLIVQGNIFTNGLLPSSPAQTRTNIFYVKPTMSVSEIQEALDDLTYNYYTFAPDSIYQLSDVLIVRRNGLHLNGNGAMFRLNDEVKKPMLFVGDITSITPVDTYRNIKIENFVLDGNKANQSSELDIDRSWIYNNAITISQCQNVIISGCEAFDCRSGGIVYTVFCNNLTIENNSCHGNFFDGIAGYTSQNVKIIGNHLYDHSNGAGISLDNDNNGLVISHNAIDTNKEGVFARWSINVQCFGNTIARNLADGMFLTGYNHFVLIE
jgi:hypothetical protein